MRRRRLHWLAAILSGLVIAYVLLVASPVPDNSAMYFARYYGVSMESVAQLSQVYNVDVSDIATFGRSPFPVNYIARQLGWYEGGPEPPVERTEVEKVVKGYVSKCELLLHNELTLYVFYSRRLQARYPFQARALMAGFHYSADGRLEWIALYDSSGDSTGPMFDWREVAQKCTPPVESGD